MDQNQTSTHVKQSQKNGINVHSANGTNITQKTDVKYSGCVLNQRGNTKTKLGKIIAHAMPTMEKLDLFWLHSRCPAKFEILVIDAVIGSKVLYGAESAQLNEGEIKRLETLHS